MENRYEQYKDSGIAWIGEIPEHWEVYKLSTLFFQHKQKNNDTQEANLLSLSYGNIKRKDINTSEGLLPESFENYNIIDKDDIVFRLTDLQNDKKSLRSALCKERGIITSAYITIRKRGNINSSYFNYLFRAYDECKVFYGLGEGVRQGMNFEDLRELEILLPEQAEQQSIATYLDQKCSEIDELITLQEEMITKLQSYKQSVITEAVTKGLDKNVPLKDSGIEWIGEIPEHWTFTIFKKFLSEPMQYGANEPAEECNYNDPRYIRITDIKDDGTLRGDTFKSLPLEKAKEYMLNKGDLLFARSGATVGKTFLYKEDYAACFAGYLIKARCNKNKLLPNFVFYYTLSNVYQNWKNSIFIQSTIQNIGADKYSVMPIIVPSLPEQQSIADYLDQKCSEIDALITIKQQKIEKLKDYKKSLIFECVTGKRKVS